MSNEHIEELLFLLAGLYSRSYPKGEEPIEIKSDGFERTISISASGKELNVYVELPLGRSYTLTFKLKNSKWEYYDYYYY